MNQQDARNLLIALNNVAGYVPPMIWQNVVNNPIMRFIDQVANSPQAGVAGSQPQAAMNGHDEVKEDAPVAN